MNRSIAQYRADQVGQEVQACKAVYLREYIVHFCDGRSHPYEDGVEGRPCSGILGFLIWDFGIPK